MTEPENQVFGNSVYKWDCVSLWAPVCGYWHILDQCLGQVSPKIQVGMAHIWSPSLCLHMHLESSRAEPVNTERKAERKQKYMHALNLYILVLVFIIASDSLR